MKLFILCLCFTLSYCGNYHENELWGKTCVDDDSVPSPGKSAEETLRYSVWIQVQLDSYRDDFITKLEKHHDYYGDVVDYAREEKKEWLRNFYWFIDEILPSEKILGRPLPKLSIEKIQNNIKHNSTVMTKIDAALKFILGTINLVAKLPDNADIMNKDLDFRRTIRESMRIIRSIICSMNNFMKSKNYQIEILLDDFLPKNITQIEVGLMLRDAFNYFEYIAQLFEAIKEEYTDKEPPYESEIWANPCHYIPPISYYFNKSLGQNDWKPDPEKAKQLAIKIANDARINYENGLKLKNQYVQFLLNYPTFNEAVADKYQDEWLRSFPWYRDEVLPKTKQLYQKIPDDYISKHLMKVFPTVLPIIHKGAKMVLSGLNRILNIKIYGKSLQPDFQKKIENYSTEVQNVLCLLSDFLRARGQEQVWLFEETRISNGWVFTIYRDSLIYLDYIADVFQFISRYQALGLDPYNPQ